MLDPASPDPALTAQLQLSADPLLLIACDPDQAAPTGAPLRVLAANDPAGQLLRALDPSGLTARLAALAEHSLGRAIRAALAGGGEHPATLVEAGIPLRLSVAAAAAGPDQSLVRLRADPPGRASSRDPLTELLTRGRLQAALEVAARRASADRPVALIALDLSRFGRINDSLGSSAGDALLVTVARRLSKLVGGRGQLARLGGDAFAVLIDPLDGPEELTSWTHRIQARLAEPFAVESHRLALVASIGVATAPADARSGRELLRLAEAALAAARRTPGGAIRLAQRDTGHAARVRFEQETHLREALAGAAAFSVAFQPQLDQAGQLVGFEALARWRPRDAVDIPPGEFIQLAEDAGLIDTLTARVIDLAAAQAACWAEAGLAPFRISVNASPSELHRPDFADRLLATCAAAGARPEHLELEVTESAVLRDPDATRATLSRLAAAGVRVALDDFGTGHSSLANLRRLPLHTLKIDRSFVQGLPDDREDAAICRAVIALGHGLGLEVVAEGIEHPGQADALRAMGCDLFQGFGLSRPMPAAEATAWLLARRAPAPPEPSHA